MNNRAASSSSQTNCMVSHSGRPLANPKGRVGVGGCFAGLQTVLPYKSKFKNSRFYRHDDIQSFSSWNQPL